MRLENSKRILAEGISVSNDTWATGVNNNTLLIGASGSGKTRGYVIPNIRQAKESLIITDPKGNLYDKLAPELAAKGYEVDCLDFKNCAESRCGYNPLDYIRMEDDGKPNEQDILTIAAAMSPVENTRDPYWSLASRDLLSSFIGYTMTYLPKEEQNLRTICKLADVEADGRYEKLLDELGQEEPEAFAIRQYSVIRTASDAEKTVASIRGVLAPRLSPFRVKGVERLSTMRNRVRFEDLRKKKTALFVNISDTDPSMDILVALFYNQAFHTLIDEEAKSGELFLPVHIIMDDFACGCRLENFDRLISVIRSRDIYASIIIQSVAQLEKLYGAAAATICENCDTTLYLGGNDPITARWIGQRSNNPAFSVLSMTVEEALLLQRGQTVKKVHRYRPENEVNIPENGADRNYSPQVATL